MELAIQVQILGEAVCISLHSNDHRKDMDPSVLLSAIVK